MEIEKMAETETLCGYCRAPLSDHGADIALICLQRLTEARSTLARELIEVVEAVSDDAHNVWSSRPCSVKHDALSALRAKCKELGIELTIANCTSMDLTFRNERTDQNSS